MNRGHQTTDIRNINKPSSGYFHYNNLEMSSNQNDNESFKLMFNNMDQNQQPHQQNKLYINSKNSKKRGPNNLTLFAKNP